MNIKFNYLYRDFSNYKRFNSIVIANPNNIPLLEIESFIREHLIDGEYFNAEKVGLPTLFFENKTEDDHDLHEFQNLEIINENPETDFHLEAFLELFKRAAIEKAKSI